MATKGIKRGGSTPVVSMPVKAAAPTVPAVAKSATPIAPTDAKPVAAVKPAAAVKKVVETKLAPAISATVTSATKAVAAAVAKPVYAPRVETAPTVPAAPKVEAVEPTSAPVAPAPKLVAPKPIAEAPVVKVPVVKAAMTAARAPAVVTEKPAIGAPVVAVANKIAETTKTLIASAPAKVAATLSTVIKETKIMATNFETITAKPAAMFGEMNERTKTAVEKSTKMVEEMNDFAKGNVEAMVEAGRIATKGAEDIAKYSADFSRSTIEKANATAKQFAGVKSPTEFFQLQGDLTKQFLDTFVTESSKFTEGYMKLMGEVAQPISNRMAVAAEKVKVAA